MYWYFTKHLTLNYNDFKKFIKYPNESGQSLHLVKFKTVISLLQVSSVKPRNRKSFYQQDDLNQFFTQIANYLIKPNIKEHYFDSFVALLYILLVENKGNASMIEIAKKHLLSEQHHLALSFELYQILKRNLSQIVCSQVVSFQIVPYKFSDHLENRCKQCFRFATFQTMGAVTGKRLTCVECFPTNGLQLLYCVLCFSHFPNSMLHRCDSPSIWSCRKCSHRFQTSALPDSLCDRCFSGHPPLVSKWHTFELNYPIIVPKQHEISNTSFKCALCEFSKSNDLKLMCNECLTISCNKCFDKWYKITKPGYELETTHTKCPFCRNVPNLKDNRTLMNFLNLVRNNKFDESFRYAVCLRCQTIKQHSRKTCQSETKIVDFVCNDCQKDNPFVTKKCPGCRVDVERIAGCDSMECPLCYTHWCWNCAQVRNSVHRCYLSSHSTIPEVIVRFNRFRNRVNLDVVPALCRFCEGTYGQIIVGFLFGCFLGGVIILILFGIFMTHKHFNHFTQQLLQIY